MKTLSVKLHPLKVYFSAAGEALKNYESAISMAEKAHQAAVDEFYLHRTDYAPGYLGRAGNALATDKAKATREYQETLSLLRTKFSEKARELTTPAAKDIDRDTLSLLNSGIVYGADEIMAMAEKFQNSGNFTMLRILNDFCQTHNIGRTVRDTFTGKDTFESLHCCQSYDEIMAVYDSFTRRMQTATLDNPFRINSGIFAEEMENAYAKLSDGIHWVEVPASEGEGISELEHNAQDAAARDVLKTVREAAENTPDQPEQDAFIRGMNGSKPETEKREKAEQRKPGEYTEEELLNMPSDQFQEAIREMNQ